MVAIDGILSAKDGAKRVASVATGEDADECVEAPASKSYASPSYKAEKALRKKRAELSWASTTKLEHTMAVEAASNKLQELIPQRSG